MGTVIAHRARARSASATVARGAPEETLVNCARLKQVLDAWIDGELDHATSGEIASHLDSCAACASLRRERDELRAHVRDGAQYHRAPAAFQSSVRRRLAAAADPASTPRRR
jgi:anti-sigma factor RsiW